MPTLCSRKEALHYLCQNAFKNLLKILHMIFSLPGFKNLFLRHLPSLLIIYQFQIGTPLWASKVSHIMPFQLNSSFKYSLFKFSTVPRKNYFLLLDSNRMNKILVPGKSYKRLLHSRFYSHWGWEMGSTDSSMLTVKARDGK